MNWREEIAFLGRVAQMMRDVADQFPAGAAELRDMAAHLETEARRKADVVRDAIHPEEMVLDGFAHGKAFKR